MFECDKSNKENEEKLRKEKEEEDKKNNPMSSILKYLTPLS